MTPPPKRGGARPGAGRPKKPKQASLTVRLPPKTKARIVAKAKRDGLTASQIVRQWADRIK